MKYSEAVLVFKWRSPHRRITHTPSSSITHLKTKPASLYISLLMMFMSFIAFSKPCLFDKSKIPTVKNQKQDSYIFCEKDTDCVLVKEACRSCTQDQLSVHKDFLEKFNQLEIEFRTKEKCIRSCEACS